MDLSEFSTEPARILIHDPRDGRAVECMDRARLAECNFLDLPGYDALCAEYDLFRAAIAKHVTVTPLASLLSSDPLFEAEADNNPNLMFMRDSSITLPWAPDLYIPARFGLASRANEPELAGRAVEVVASLQPAPGQPATDGQDHDQEEHNHEHDPSPGPA